MAETTELARTKTIQPAQSREKGQRSLQLPDYITRIIPVWRNPDWLMGETWRAVVKSQPVAMICRETLTANVTSLDWKIEPRDSNKRDELRDLIDYYTRFFENTGEYDWTHIIEWLTADYLDLPFGAGMEVGRENDSPDGKVYWIKPIDGATLFPTLNTKYPVGQYLRENPGNYVYFPAHGITRLYMSPRTEIRREGWGMAPPEKIYLALELLNRGDVYYANLLLDTPPPGILDLLDMEKDSATLWLESWKSLLGGIDPFKIPVLYEHEKAAQFVSFTKSPTELMFDKATAKYVAITTAGYGMSIGDIGLPTMGSGGETLAGTIRQERRTRRTGFGILKKKLKYLMDRILPESLEFKWIDMDDELNVAIGRARLSTSTAMQLLVESGILLKDEARQQLVRDGLLTISIPESIEGGDEVVGLGNEQNKQVGMLGNPVPPSQGGHGEVKVSLVEDDSDPFSKDLADAFSISDPKLRRAIRATFPIFSEVKEIYPALYENGLVEYWGNVHDTYLFTGEYIDDAEVPEAVSVTVEASLSNLHKKLTIPIKWSEDTRKYLESIFEKMYRSRLYNELLLDYEIGKSDVEPIFDEIVLNANILRNFNSVTAGLLDAYGEKTIDIIYRCILSGVRKHLTSQNNAIKLADVLDIETFIGDNILEVVKNSLANGFINLINEFGIKFAEESQKYLEEN